MRAYKQLFFIALPCILLAGCGALPHAPPEQPAGSAAAPAPSSKAPERTTAAPRRSEQSPELLLQVLATEGFDYHRGGQSHATGFDCSGLVAHVFQQAYNLKLPHNALAQSRYGRSVAQPDLEIGDLVFFNTERPYSHVGIYLGDRRFIHAPKPGAVVRTENMDARYWQKRYDGARRLVE